MNEGAQIDPLLVKYHNNFASHRVDIRINTEIEARFTPKHDDEGYAQRLPTPVNLKDEILVELALM